MPILGKLCNSYDTAKSTIWDIFSELRFLCRLIIVFEYDTENIKFIRLSLSQLNCIYFSL